MSASRRVKVRVRHGIRISVWLVRGYAHVFVFLSVAIATLVPTIDTPQCKGE